MVDLKTIANGINYHYKLVILKHAELEKNIDGLYNELKQEINMYKSEFKLKLTNPTYGLNKFINIKDNKIQFIDTDAQNIAKQLLEFENNYKINIQDLLGIATNNGSYNSIIILMYLKNNMTRKELHLTTKIPEKTIIAKLKKLENLKLVHYNTQSKYVLLNDNTNNKFEEYIVSQIKSNSTKKDIKSMFEEKWSYNKYYQTLKSLIENELIAPPQRTKITLTSAFIKMQSDIKKIFKIYATQEYPYL